MRFRGSFLAGLLLSVLLAGGCTVNPVTGERELSLMSTEEEIATGERYFLQFQQASGGLYTADPALVGYVRRVGRRVAAVSDRDLPYEFVVLNSDVANAWALPGGKIAVTRGLLETLDNEAELAALLGHEIVHAAARHGAQRLQRAQLGQLALFGVAVATRESAYSDLIGFGSGLALRMFAQKYNRDEERESDYYGMKYMHAAGYDSSAAVTLHEKFLALSKGRKPTWLQALFETHPPSAERVENNRAALAKFPAGGTLGRAAYREKTAYLRARKDAYEDGREAEDLLDSNPDAALRAIDAAIAREPREARFHGTRGRILARQGRHREAVRAFGAAIRRDGNYYAYYLDRGLSHDWLDRRGRALRDLERSMDLLPTAEAAYALGRIWIGDGKRQEAKGLFEAAARGGGEAGRYARQAYIRLDIADAPERYIAVEPVLSNGEVFVRVRNRTEFDFADIVVRADATIDGQPGYWKTGRLARLGAYGTDVVSTGLYFGDRGIRVAARAVRAAPAF